MLTLNCPCLWPLDNGLCVSHGERGHHADAPRFTDHHELHQAGACGGACPWCVHEAADLGGEG